MMVPDFWGATKLLMVLAALCGAAAMGIVWLVVALT